MKAHQRRGMAFATALYERETLAEIDALDLWIVAQLLRRSGPEDSAFVDDISAIGDRQSFTNVVVRDKYPNPILLQRRDYLLKVQHRDWVNSRKGLV